MDASKEEVLANYGVSPDARLAGGMEAEVYACGEGRVLKLYRGSAHLDNLKRLMEFYQGLQREALPYALPRIQTLTMEGEFCISIEDRLQGVNLAEMLPGLAPTEMDGLMQTYLDAVLALEGLLIPAGFQRRLLFDSEGFSDLENGGWHSFLKEFLRRKLITSEAHLSQDVAAYPQKLGRLHEILAGPEPEACQLIHGDFFPGNLLVGTGTLSVTALLDFGLFTMQGDSLFDLATAWVFFDMYDDLKINARERLQEMIVNRFGRAIQAKLHRYVLIYSLLSANTYAPDCSDGHYRWCVENLNRAQCWQELA